jgi:hypothetical protein
LGCEGGSSEVVGESIESGTAVFVRARLGEDLNPAEAELSYSGANGF